MGKFLINGRCRLVGQIDVSGSKNAALPIVFATIIKRGISVIKNLPDITDVRIAVKIIEKLGAKISTVENTTYIDTRELVYSLPSESDVSALRASTYLLGACLSRFGISRIERFGGCNFAQRPIDMHLMAAEKFGAKINGDIITADGLHGATVSFDKRSVGATVNALIMASGIPAHSVLVRCAREPHIEALIDFLRSAGAEIVLDNDVIYVRGCELHGGNITVPGDMIEAGTYLCASLITDGDVSVFGFDANELSPLYEVFDECGVMVNIADGGVSLSGLPKGKIRISTAAYPGFPTDLQPIISTVLAVYGGGEITENVWRGRFGYLSELSRLGLAYSLCGNTACIYPSHIHSATLSATDLRGGAAAILLALSTDGTSTVERGEYVLRGYEKITDKLKALGADIRYVE